MIFLSPKNGQVFIAGLTVNFRKGFTLPEVCVALTVFLVGTTSFLCCLSFFNREVADERLRLERFYDVVQAMEFLMTERPKCIDTVMTLNIVVTGALPVDSSLDLQNFKRNAVLPQHPVSVRLTRVPSFTPLVWAVVDCENFYLKRLIRCR